MKAVQVVEVHELTKLLKSWSQGDYKALDALVPRVQDELRRLAHRLLAREYQNHSLQTTALINEAYLRLLGGKPVSWQSREHFFAVAVQLMRHILVDLAKRRKRLKRGGGAFQTAFDEESFVFRPDRTGDIVSLDEALIALAKVDGRKSQIVELRFFGGFSVAEAALLLELSETTVRREWRYAKAWLKRHIRGQEKGPFNGSNRSRPEDPDDHESGAPE